jgi:hypothetical protein
MRLQSLSRSIWRLSVSRVAGDKIMIIAKTITDAQIAALRDESAVAGDLAMVGICRRALGSRLPYTDAMSQQDRDIIDRFLTQDMARAECARVIDDTEAQRA